MEIRRKGQAKHSSSAKPLPPNVETEENVMRSNLSGTERLESRIGKWESQFKSIEVSMQEHFRSVETRIETLERAAAANGLLSLGPKTTRTPINVNARQGASQARTQDLEQANGELTSSPSMPLPSSKRARTAGSDSDQKITTVYSDALDSLSIPDLVFDVQ